MPRSARTSVVLLLLAAIAGCSGVKPLTQPGHDYAETDDENWLIDQAHQAAAEMDERGVELDDPALAAYLGRIGGSLQPANLPPGFTFRYHVIRSPDVNAFAMPDGNIYLPVGLLAQLDNEAQLAQVLAHEMTHVLERHGIEALRDRRRKAVAVQVASMATLGIAGAFAAVPYTVSVTSYRRDQEEEADGAALKLVRGAGYDASAAASVYDTLAAIVPPASDGESIYSTHPSLTTRSEYARALVSAAPGSTGRVDADAYRAAMASLEPEFSRLLVQRRQFAAAQRRAEAVLKRTPDAAWAHCAKAAAHHAAADDPDAAALEQALHDGQPTLTDDLVNQFKAAVPAEREQAAASYRRCLELDATAAAAHRGLGMLAQQRGDPVEARRELSRYLVLAPDAPDRRYVAHLLAEGAQ